MLIIPLEKSIDWRKPPVFTFLLIIINSLVLFFTHAQDEKILKSSTNYYISSVLPKIELPLYIETQPDIIDNLNNTNLIAMIKNNAANEKTIVYVLMTMESDAAFMKKLHNNEIIHEQDNVYPEWKTARSQFENSMQSSMSSRYKFIPSQHKPITFLTHQFLHGGYDHLFGNMLFLFLIGFALETALGGWLYFSCYLISGLGAVILYWQVYPSSDVGLVGASGAISGLMGMYAGVFGLRKIRFFYSLLFYFDYIKAPALIMLPLWIMNEIYQLFFTTGSHIAYVAHVGGLLTGGIISFAIKQYFTEQIDTQYLDQSEQQDEKKIRYEQGMKLLRELKIAQAQVVFASLQAQYPDDFGILMQYYKTLKYTPEVKEYHPVVGKILEMADSYNVKQIVPVFSDYIKASQKVRLAPNLLIKLVLLFSKSNNPIEAEIIIENLLRKSADIEGLDQALFRLAMAWQRQGNSEKYMACLNLLVAHYPTQTIGINANRLLRELGSQK
jgi:membrane associated rhomboid family serine protease